MESEGEDAIAVGSRGTLLSLMGKEMAILEARRSCSITTVSTYMSKRSASSKWDPNYGISASVSSYTPPPPTNNIVSSLWGDLKGLLLRSPLHNASSSTTVHTNALFCKHDLEDQYNHLLHNSAPFFIKSSTTHHPYISPQYAEAFSLNQKPSSPSEYPSILPPPNYPIRQSPSPHHKSSSTVSMAPPFPIRKSPMRDCASMCRASTPAGHSNQKPPRTHYPKEKAVDDAPTSPPKPKAAPRSDLHHPKEKARDVDFTACTTPTKQIKSPRINSCPKEKAVDEVSSTHGVDLAQKGKICERSNRTSRKSYCYIVEQFRRDMEGCSCGAMQELLQDDQWWMQKPILQSDQDISAPPSSPVFSTSSFRSLGGRSFAPLVDLQCCYTPDRSKRLSFTRLSHF